MSDDEKDKVIAEIVWTGFGCWPKFVLEKCSRLIVANEPIYFLSVVPNENPTEQLSRTYRLDENIHELILPPEEYLGYVFDSLMEEFILGYPQARVIRIYPSRNIKDYVKVIL